MIGLKRITNAFLKGWHGQNALWNMITTTPIAVSKITLNDLKRIHYLMEKYRDTPMDFADASLVVAENLKTNKVFTLDSDFAIYRINGRKSFEIIP